MGLVQRENGVGQSVGGIEAAVAEVAVQSAVELVRPAPGDYVDITAHSAAELGLASRSDHLDLLDYVEAIEDPAEAGGVVIGGEAVDDETVGEVALAADGKALSGNSRGFGEQLVARGVDPDFAFRHVLGARPFGHRGFEEGFRELLEDQTGQRGA